MEPCGEVLKIKTLYTKAAGQDGLEKKKRKQKLHVEGSLRILMEERLANEVT